ncbi:helix-turn-helix domain-containing protein [Jeotgalibacillus aurantiacus]|uniref:helix-turn-helix domain-containing protein n=1 Tax=Jeotgalibacillus aurantiacus TaxID=2763266 RepID=UPI001D0BE299|nr:helix-turn-helix domain-containing protein [Jeotgalibacillus aurantiacus]
MKYSEAIYLIGLDLFKGERSDSALYHLLTGKKTSQTIQDAHLFGLSPLFSIVPNLKRKQYDETIHHLKTQGCLSVNEASKSLVTDKGKEEVRHYFFQHYFPAHLDGWRYGESGRVFWGRISLLIQTLSNLTQNESRFFPVIRDRHIQSWVKDQLINSKTNKKALFDQLYHEWKTLFQSTDYPDDPLLIVQQFSGWNLIGLTHAQQADYLSCSPDEVYYRFINVLHFSLAKIVEEKEAYPMLHHILKDQLKQDQLYTVSTAETKRLLDNGMDLIGISQKRRLKPSTIEDHILELALLDRTLKKEPFVSEELYAAIREVAARSGSKRLKVIKEAIPDADYFQIRFVLAKENGEANQWNSYYRKNLALNSSEKDKGRSSATF